MKKKKIVLCGSMTIITIQEVQDCAQVLGTHLEKSQLNGCLSFSVISLETCWRSGRDPSLWIIISVYPPPPPPSFGHCIYFFLIPVGAPFCKLLVGKGIFHPYILVLYMYIFVCLCLIKILFIYFQRKVFMFPIKMYFRLHKPSD